MSKRTKKTPAETVVAETAEDRNAQIKALLTEYNQKRNEAETFLADAAKKARDIKVEASKIVQTMVEKFGTNGAFRIKDPETGEVLTASHKNDLHFLKVPSKKSVIDLG